MWVVGGRVRRLSIVRCEETKDPWNMRGQLHEKQYQSPLYDPLAIAQPLVASIIIRGCELVREVDIMRYAFTG